MIRNVVLMRLNPGTDLHAVEPGLKAITELDPPGMVDCKVGTDLRLRDGAWDAAITIDFVDEASYREYDLEDEHNRIRRELFGPYCAEIARVQFAI
jgi:hypothetical protein